MSLKKMTDTTREGEEDSITTLERDARFNPDRMTGEARVEGVEEALAKFLEGD